MNTDVERQDDAHAGRVRYGDEHAHARRVRYGWGYGYAAAGLLGVHALLLGLSIPRNAVTIDEVVHLPTGMAYWQRGEFWGYHHSPPLVRLLFALPAVLMDVPIDYSGYHYRTRPRPVDCELGREFMLLNRNHYMFVFCMSRAVVAGLSVLGAYFVFRWSRELFGDLGGLLSLSLWMFSPDMLAHGGLVTTDLGSTVLGFIATQQFWRYLQTPSLERALWCGVLLGLTEATKFSFIALPVVWAGMAVVALLARRRAPVPQASRLRVCGSSPDGGSASLTRRRDACGTGAGGSYGCWTAAWHALVVAGISLLVLNDVYLGEGTGRRLGEFEFRSQTLTKEVQLAGGPLTPGPSPPGGGEGRARRENRFRGTALENVRMPFPKHYLLGFDDQMWDVDTGLYYKYLRGELRRGYGWWYYYFYAMLVKTPVAALILMVGGLAAVALRRCRADAVSEAALLLPIVVFFATVSSQSGLQYLRYMLPAYPFLFVSAGRLGRILDFGFSILDWRWAASLTLRVGVAGAVLGVVLLVAWNAVSVLRVHPHYLIYFNEPAGGPRNGLAHLEGSSIDWGQGLVALKEWLDEHAPGKKIRLAYFGTMYPEVLGIDYELPPFGPEATTAVERDPAEVGPVPGLQAVGANYLLGVPFPAPNAQGRQTGVPLNAYTYYRRFEPIATPGWSIYVYDLGLEEVNRVRREMGVEELE
jgi:hypothetical protein